MNTSAKEVRKLGRPPSPHAEHRRVASELRKLIAQPRRRIGEVLPSLRQLAGELGTTLSAVRQAVELLKREKRIALNARQRLVVSRNLDPAMDGGGIVLVVNADPLKGPWGAYFTALFAGIIQGAGDIGAPILLAHGPGFRSAMPVGFLDYSLRGVVLAGRFTAEVLRGYERLPIPVVIADTPVNDRKIHSVCVDNAKAMRDAVKYLVALGHRRIGFVRFVLYSLRDVDPDSKERQAGFLQACQEAGLPASKDWIFNVLAGVRTDFHPLRRLVCRGSHFTAAITVDGNCADHVQQAAAEFGKEAPRQLRIVTVNAQGAPSRYSGPQVDFTELGRRAGPLLSHPKEPPIRIRVPTTWYEAESV